MKNSFYKVLCCFFAFTCAFNAARAQLTAAVNSYGTICNENNGIAVVTPSGGSGYTYQWSAGGSSNDTATGLAPGNYSVTVYSTPVTDSVVESFTIAASTVPSLSISSLYDTVCTGTPVWLVGHGLASGNYIWSGGTLPGQVTADSLLISTGSGNFTYSITAAPGCPATASFTLTSYLVKATLNSVSNPTCGRNNGTIICSVNGGAHKISTFLYNGSVLSSGAGTQINGTAATGTYLFFVYDATTGCSDTLPPIVLTDTSSHATLSGIAVVADSCYGMNKGSITVSLANCGPGCVCSWSRNPADTTPVASNLAAGPDTFKVSKGGCLNIDTVIFVPGPLAPFKDSLVATADHCGKHDGAAVAHISGGTVPYHFTWSLGTVGTQPDSVGQITGDTSVNVLVTDSFGCMLKDTAFIGTTPRPVAHLSAADTICVKDNSGFITVTPTSADGPFSYLWSNGQRTAAAVGLSPGAYSVTVNDNFGCDTVLTDTVRAYSSSFAISAFPGYTVSPGQTVELTIHTDITPTDIIWQPYIPGSRGSTDVSYIAQQTDTFAVFLYFGQHCIDTQYVEVGVDTFGLSSQWVIPNTFTPNGDGVNDFYKLITYPNVSSFHIWIYDRWGNKVYESTDVNFQWNGLDQYSGDKPLNTGVFAYVIQYESLDKPGAQEIGGNISLVK